MSERGATTAPTLLVVAKAPVAGYAKTRLARTIGPVAAAEVAAAALLDTLDVAQSVGWPVVVALAGDLADAFDGDAVDAALEHTEVVAQVGDGLGERLAAAHRAADRGHGVVQVGMDTPQVTADDYRAAGTSVAAGRAVIGPADDGGWWLLGLPDARRASVLTEVPMSTGDTGRLTELALGGSPDRLRELRDIDGWDDALAVAAGIPGSRTGRVVGRLAVGRGVSA
ncbi:hypothetical protein HMPREF0063_12664 [Aeromicrobium marinum DSM 15272]|uniref:DUF2064 domain-containing protein n=1 Tax=Aeromicrobium marinum DSM 15272 TaxID=585531 RepID=E2SF55_9ACTN|nr:DUF2064 domain-containing protein [Aeromicrobium marinum]EFQ82140.1 hypothetical protein HMPREF0063_12664 [Aeromicrobium marinum DSM 15272]